MEVLLNENSQLLNVLHASIKKFLILKVKLIKSNQSQTRTNNNQNIRINFNINIDSTENIDFDCIKSLLQSFESTLFILSLLVEVYIISSKL